MKNRNWLFLSFVFFLFTACAVVEPVVEDYIEWSVVEAQFVSFKSEKNYEGAEKYARQMLLERWADWQMENLHYRLGRALYFQGKYRESLNIFRRMKDTKQFRPRVHLTAGEASLKLRNYDEALDWVLNVYLELPEEWKPGASRIIFLSYLYSRRIDKAAVWYSKLDDVKREAVNKELEEWKSKSERNRVSFNNALADVSEISIEEWSAELLEKAIEELEIIDELEEVEIIDEIVDDEVIIDESYVPDPNQLCLMLSKDEKWLKFNEVIDSFFRWYFSKYRKEGVNINTMLYGDSQDVQKSFEKARELKCFAVAGPFFSYEFTFDFIKASIETSIPVVSFNNFITERRGNLFNVMTTKDVESENIIDHVIREMGIDRFALAYIDGREGKILRDVYWKTVEKLGGKVTEVMVLGASKNSYMEDVEKVVSKPENFDEAVKAFRARNKDRFSNETLLRRAVDRFIRTAPGQCDFDALILLTPLNYLPMIVPSFPYANMEFLYYQNYLNRNVRLKQQSLDKEGHGWKIQQILLLPPSEIAMNERVISQLGNYVDGMIIHAPVNDLSESNELYRKMSESFFEGSGRKMFAIENYIAETAEIINQAREKALAENISNPVHVLRDQSFVSLTTGREVYFDEKNRLRGNTSVMIGRVKEPFMTPEMIEEQEKQKAEEQEKQKKQEKQSGKEN